MKTIFTKTCALCDTQISSSYRLCASCFKQYGNFIDTDWFREIEKQQTRQDSITRKESNQLPFSSSTDIHGVADKYEGTAHKKDIGRPQLHWKLRNQVLELYDQSVAQQKIGKGRKLSLRAIAKLLDNQLGYVSVRNILIEYGRIKPRKINKKSTT